MPKTPQSGGYAKNKGMETSLTKKMGGRDQLGNFLGMDKEDPKMGEGGGDGRIQKWGDEL